MSVANDQVQHDPGLDAQQVQQRLVARAAAYEPAWRGETVTAKCHRQSLRPNSALFEFQLTGVGISRRVVVKVPQRRPLPVDREAARVRADRPRLYPRAPRVSKGAWECTAMQAIEQHFATLGDPRFGYVRVLDRWIPEEVLVLDHCPDRPLRGCLAGLHRWAGWKKNQQMARWCVHAGAWLREFHSLPAAPWVQTRSATLTEFTTAVERFEKFLVDRVGQRRFNLSVTQTMAVSAESLFRSPPPLAVMHGDFAPRNLFVSRDDRVTVIDTMACWRAPACEDLAYFRLALTTHARQCATLNQWHSRAQIAVWEQALLSGYFSEEAMIPWPWLRLWEALLTLDRWIAMVHRAGSGEPASTRSNSRLQGLLWNHHLAAHLRWLVQELSRS